jgi:hypothetical protein
LDFAVKINMKITRTAAPRRAVLALLAVVLAIQTDAAQNNSNSRHPNILLIISDDIGLDVTTNMYPGLVDDLVRKYGPEGLNHPNYKAIKGASGFHAGAGADCAPGAWCLRTPRRSLSVRPRGRRF